MDASDYIAIGAAFIACIAALFAGLTWKENRRMAAANETMATATTDSVKAATDALTVQRQAFETDNSATFLAIVDGYSTHESDAFAKASVRLVNNGMVTARSFFADAQLLDTGPFSAELIWQDDFQVNERRYIHLKAASQPPGGFRQRIRIDVHFSDRLGSWVEEFVLTLADGDQPRSISMFLDKHPSIRRRIEPISEPSPTDDQ